MPLPARLEPFLLHESSMVRDSVGFHFFESWPPQEELAPLVLKAESRYGEEATLNLLSFGCRFPLSTRSLLEALRALTRSRPPFVEHWVAMAPLPLVKGSSDLLRSVLSPRAMARLERRRSFHQETTTELWRRLEGLCRKLDVQPVERGENDEIDDLVEALAVLEHRENVADKILAIQEVASSHLRWALVEMAGVMGLSELDERLVSLLGATDEAVARGAAGALARIGSTSVVSTIGDRYPGASRRFRRFALSVLKAVKLDSSEGLLRELAERERDPALRGRIFDGLRFHFTEGSESLLKRELERPSSHMIPEEIRKALHVFAALRGERGETPYLGDREIYFHLRLMEE